MIKIKYLYRPYTIISAYTIIFDFENRQAYTNRTVQLFGTAEYGTN